jgi:hypothetical protein
MPREESVAMKDPASVVFVGLEITPRLQEGLDNCKEAMKVYFCEDKPEFLKVIRAGGRDLLGRELAVPLPCAQIDNIQRHIVSLVKLIVPNFRFQPETVGVHILDLPTPPALEQTPTTKVFASDRPYPDYPGGNDF